MIAYTNKRIESFNRVLRTVIFKDYEEVKDLTPEEIAQMEADMETLNEVLNNRYGKSSYRLEADYQKTWW